MCFVGVHWFLVPIDNKFATCSSSIEFQLTYSKCVITHSWIILKWNADGLWSSMLYWYRIVSVSVWELGSNLYLSWDSTLMNSGKRQNKPAFLQLLAFWLALCLMILALTRILMQHLSLSKFERYVTLFHSLLICLVPCTLSLTIPAGCFSACTHCANSCSRLLSLGIANQCPNWLAPEWQSHASLPWGLPPPEKPTQRGS
jgi:hypothetical protein